MREISIYIITDVGKNPETGHTLLEMRSEYKGKPLTGNYSVFFREANKREAMLEGIIEAVRHITQGTDDHLTLYLAEHWVCTQIEAGNLWKWEKQGFRNSKGEPIAYAGLWEAVADNMREFLREPEKRVSAKYPVPFDVQASIMSWAAQNIDGWNISKNQYREDF